ncbi:hypothetical protein R6242_16220 [Iodobacter sp. CM08]|uniref:hypothetical protein n=1 Tax=Iodobacter sp. CM08 TaxID=3085902 RepID=UPI002981AADF|nr:hypothetical protein [Iodobacter sp. CM08]MDW5418113.1 hypothetical protein [Iodobacter sp. CM08]
MPIFAGMTLFIILFIFMIVRIFTSTFTGAVGWTLLVLLVLAGIGWLLGLIEERSAKKRAQVINAESLRIAAQYPFPVRVISLSTGMFLVVEVATGKSLAEVERAS